MMQEAKIIQRPHLDFGNFFYKKYIRPERPISLVLSDFKWHSVFYQKGVRILMECGSIADFRLGYLFVICYFLRCEWFLRGIAEAYDGKTFGCKKGFYIY